MKTKVAVLVVLLLLLGSTQLVHGSSEIQSIVAGPLHWTRFSVCEHPLHPGLFLNYYVTDGCWHEAFLYGKLTQEMVGSTIWAEGTLLENGGCKILDISTFSLCRAADPGAGQ